MVGANTVLKDNPFLTNRVSGRQPERIIVDSAMRIPAGSNVFSDIKRSPVTIAVSRPSKKIVRYNGLARILVAGEKDGKVDLRRLFSALAKEGMTHIMVEGGGEIAASLIKERLADRFIFFIAPKIIGGKYAVTSVEGEGIAAVKDAYRLRYLSVRKFSEDLVIEAEAVQCLPE
jgi:diaminohydroxyphosphoribosylaminopyrimidine deaminase/5-amino-6-(5-phosphoribosylamino)uracil reductase